MTNNNFGNPGPSNNPYENSPQQPGPPPGAWGSSPNSPQNHPPQQAWPTQDGAQQPSGNASQSGLGKRLDFSDKSVLWLALVAAAGLLVFIGSFMTWGKITAAFIGSITISGTDGDGIATLILALVLIVGIAVMLLGGWWSRNRWRSVPVIVIGVILLLISLLDIANIVTLKEELEDDSTSVSLGGGLILILLASIAIIAFGVLTLLNDKKQMASGPAQFQPNQFQPGYPTTGPSGHGQPPHNWQGNQPPNPQ